MRSQSWKPAVYLSVTLAGVAVVLGSLYLGMIVFYREFSLIKLLQHEGKLTLLTAGMIAFGTVVAITHLLQRHYKRAFGSYLDDPDVIEPTARPPLEKICTRCGLLFAAFRNDFHAAGFCSRACQDAFTRRTPD